MSNTTSTAIHTFLANEKRAIAGVFRRVFPKGKTLNEADIVAAAADVSQIVNVVNLVKAYAEKTNSKDPAVLIGSLAEGIILYADKLPGVLQGPDLEGELVLACQEVVNLPLATIESVVKNALASKNTPAPQSVEEVLGETTTETEAPAEPAEAATAAAGPVTETTTEAAEATTEKEA